MTSADHPVHDAALIERERELRAIERLIDEAAGGRGRIALIEGPAGIGKTRLLAEARASAAARGGMTVLHARCSELERDFPFGAVRQLFESAGVPAQAAEPVADADGIASGGEHPGEGSFAALHALHCEIVERSERQPLLLAIDDVQWSDVPSLRFIAYLAHRMEQLPLLLVLTLRSTDPGTDPGLIDYVTSGPLSESIRPEPLGDDAVARLVAARLGPAHPRFLEACRVATGGNPLLLCQLLGALADDGVRPTASSADAVRRIGSRAIARTVLSRLARLHCEALAVARAVATLGESSSVATLTALTGLDEPTVATATTALAHADILRAETTPFRFAHPLVRDAIYHDVPGGERELAHARAAELLADRGADEEEVAAQLVHAARRGRAETVALLRGAARRAARSGAPESAVTYLARALQEPPAAGLRPTVQLELGLAASDWNAPTAAAHLRAAYRELEDPFQRTTAAQALAKALLFIADPNEAAQLAREVVAELPAALEDERHLMESMDVLSVVFGGDSASALAQVATYHRLPPNAGIGSRCLAAAVAFMWAVSDRPPSDSEALLLDALDDGALLESADGLIWSAVAMTLQLSGSERTATFLEQARAIAYRRGSTFAAGCIEQWRGFHLLGSDLPAAGDALRQAVSLQVPWGTDVRGGSWARGYLCLATVAIGEPQHARAALGQEPEQDDRSDGANVWRGAAAELALDEERWEDALAIATRIGRTPSHVVHPDWTPWRSAASRALAGLGRGEEALETMREDLAIARRCAPAPTVGRCLRELGELEGGAGLARLREAIATLEPTPARLELARALVALGRRLAPGAEDGDAIALLRRGRELATACGCPPLVRTADRALAERGDGDRAAAHAKLAAGAAQELPTALGSD